MDYDIVCIKRELTCQI